MSGLGTPVSISVLIHPFWCRYHDLQPRYARTRNLIMAAADGLFLSPFRFWSWGFFRGSIMHEPVKFQHNGAIITQWSYCDSTRFQDARRPSYWIVICAWWTNHKDDMVVRKCCQNLTLTRSVFLRYCNLSVLSIWLRNIYLDPCQGIADKTSLEKTPPEKKATEKRPRGRNATR